MVSMVKICSGNTTNVEQEVNKLLDKIERAGLTLVDIKFTANAIGSTNRNSQLHAMIIYK